MRSFLEVSSESHFPIQNLPYGVFRPKTGGDARVGVAIGESVLDLSVLESRGLLDLPGVAGGVFCRPSLNTFMSLGRESWTTARARITQLLREDEPTLCDDDALRTECLIPQTGANQCNSGASSRRARPVSRLLLCSRAETRRLQDMAFGDAPHSPARNWR